MPHLPCSLMSIVSPPGTEFSAYCFSTSIKFYLDIVLLSRKLKAFITKWYKSKIDLIFSFSPPSSFLFSLSSYLSTCFLFLGLYDTELHVPLAGQEFTAEPAMTLNAWPFTGAEIARPANSLLTRVNGLCIYLSVGISLFPSLCGEAPVTTRVKNVALSPSVWSLEKQSTENSLFLSSSALHRWTLFFPQLGYEGLTGTKEISN